MSTDFVIEYHLMRDMFDEKEWCKNVNIQSNIKENRKKIVKYEYKDSWKLALKVSH